MNSLFEFSLKFRNTLLLKCNDDNTAEISSEEIHQFRKSLEQLEDKTFIEKYFDFINEVFDFDEFYIRMCDISYDYQEHLENTIKRTFAPLLIYLMDNEYEIQIKKIKNSELLEEKESNILKYIEEMENSYYNNDFGNVTTLSSTILTSIFKEVCKANVIDYGENDDFMKLYSYVKEVLKLHPSLYEDKKSLQIISSKINILLQSINEIRNIYSNSHGNTNSEYLSYQNLPKHHYKLIIDCTKTISNFLLETNEYQGNRLNI